MDLSCYKFAFLKTQLLSIKKAVLSLHLVRDAEPIEVVGGEREMERLEEKERESGRGKKKNPLFCLFILKKFVLPTFNLCHRSCTSCHHVHKARLVSLSLFFPPFSSPSFFFFYSLLPCIRLRI